MWKLGQNLAKILETSLKTRFQKLTTQELENQGNRLYVVFSKLLFYKWTWNFKSLIGKSKKNVLAGAHKISILYTSTMALGTRLTRYLNAADMKAKWNCSPYGEFFIHSWSSICLINIFGPSTVFLFLVKDAVFTSYSNSNFGLTCFGDVVLVIDLKDATVGSFQRCHWCNIHKDVLLCYWRVASICIIVSV
jgi:hypothetical protein